MVVLAGGVSANFEEASVEIVDCPNFNQYPYNFYREGSRKKHISNFENFYLTFLCIRLLFFLGLCGNPIILDVGGPSYLLPTAQKNKFYDIKTLLQKLNYNYNTLVIGAGAGPWPHTGSNCEVCTSVHFIHSI